MDDDQAIYERWKIEQEKRWESLCGRCGACCGIVENDPCEHLRGSKKGEYYCSIYENRFGEHKTIHGRIFRCVPMRQIIHVSWPGDECCGYKQELKNNNVGGKGIRGKE